MFVDADFKYLGRILRIEICNDSLKHNTDGNHIHWDVILIGSMVDKLMNEYHRT